jgi:putative spermidine/putrescine transport system substrate-binding protein
MAFGSQPPSVPDSSISRRKLLGGILLGGIGAIAVACSSSPPNPTVAPAAATTAPAPTTAPAAAPTAASTASPAATAAAAATSAPAATATTAPAAAAAPASGGAVTLNHYLSGDVNIRDLWLKSLIPAYQKASPSVTINLVFDEHGSADATTFDRIAAAKKASKVSGVDTWETGGFLQQGGDTGLIVKLSEQLVPNLAKVPANVLGQYNSYGVPYRGSSVVLAYNSKNVANPPTTLDDLLAWIKANPGQFTYNPPDKGGSGSAFVTRVLKTGISDSDEKLFETGYDQSKESEWDKGWGTLKDLAPSIYNQGNQAFYPQGNVPVLQTLGKGAINVAPVWSDQGLQYLAQNLLPPEVKLTQISPAFSGGGAFVGVVADSPNKEAAYAYLNWLLTPDPQQIIINTIKGYPGLDWKYMPADVQARFADVAKDFSFGFSSKFGSDLNQQWYEKVAGTPPPTPSG